MEPRDATVPHLCVLSVRFAKNGGGSIAIKGDHQLGCVESVMEKKGNGWKLL